MAILSALSMQHHSLYSNAASCHLNCNQRRHNIEVLIGDEVVMVHVECLVLQCSKRKAPKEMQVGMKFWL